MAIDNAKILNTRIILKNDDLAKWSTSSLILEKGEIALAAITSNTTGDVSTPTYLMKVGDGVNTFANLKWVGAQAADVYNWAKQNSLYIEAAGTGNVVSDIVWDETLNDNKGGVKVTKVSVATSTQLTEALNRVTALETGKLDASTFNTFKTENTAAIATAKSEAISAAAEDATEKVNALTAEGGAVKANTDAIAAIKDGTTIDSFADVETALAGKQAAGDYATKAEAQGYANAKDSAIAAAKQAGDNARAYAEGVAGDLSDFESEVASTYETKIDAAGKLTEAKGYTDTEVSKVSTAVANEKTRAEGVEAGLRTDVDAIKDDYLKAADKQALQTQIDTIMNNPDTEGVINSITEFTQYIEDHGEIADGFRTDIDKNKEDIAANAQAIADEAQRAKDEEASLLAKINTLDTNGATQSELNEAVSTLEGKISAAQTAAEGNAKTYTDGEIDKVEEALSTQNTTLVSAIATAKQGAIDAAAADATTKAGTAETNAKTYADTVAGTAKTEAIAAAAEDAAKKYEKIGVAQGLVNELEGELAAIAKTGSTDDLVQGTKVLVFNCGTSAV